MSDQINIENASEWVSGDGGPIVVIQETAVTNWDGAGDYKESLMAGGTKRTDYDVICELKDGVHVLNHKGFDMIVMSDCEWATQAFRRGDQLVLFQSMGHEGDPRMIADECFKVQPDEVLKFRQQSKSLRLMVGADSGKQRFYESHTAALAPGIYTIRVYFRTDCFVAALKKA